MRRKREPETEPRSLVQGALYLSQKYGIWATVALALIVLVIAVALGYARSPMLTTMEQNREAIDALTKEMHESSLKRDAQIAQLVAQRVAEDAKRTKEAEHDAALLRLMCMHMAKTETQKDECAASP